jgi:transketolase
MNPDLVHSLNSLKILSVDMIQYAKSGNSGIALGAAPIVFDVFTNHLRIKPDDPTWPNRDRFVMSAGHGSALLYAMMFMAGYDISIDDLVDYRKLDSKTPAYPEYRRTPGIEATTGPLGQGFAMAVGMALAGKYTGALVEEQVPKQRLVDYYVYCLVSDGDLQEGITWEAASFAGTHSLNNLIVLYDSNATTSDGELKLSANESVIQKFIHMGWEVDYVSEGNDVREIDKAIDRAKINRKPTLIEIQTTIGKGSQHEGKSLIHATPLTREDMAFVRKSLNITTNTLEITENAVKYVRQAIANRVNTYYNNWQSLYKETLNSTNEALNTIATFLQDGEPKISFSSTAFKIPGDYNEELRESNSKMLNIVSDRSKFFLGGSCDLASFCHTSLYKESDMSRRNRTGKNISFGLREHGMAGIMNGMALCGLRVYGSTFLVYADYMKPAIRMACMMNLPVTYVFTYDSISIGDDGPTVAPVEQLEMLRAIPNLTVFRPADINEVIGCWDYIINNKKPVAIVLSKDDAHILDGTVAEEVKKGAYIVKKEQERLDGVVIGTGLDFTTAYLVCEELRAKGHDLRVVSMPSVELFNNQTKEYKDSVIPPGVKVFTIEAGTTNAWYRFASPGCAIGVDWYGYSGDRDAVLQKLGFDYESILKKIEEKL